MSYLRYLCLLAHSGVHHICLVVKGHYVHISNCNAIIR
jgi:hypothetical protein